MVVDSSVMVKWVNRQDENLVERSDEVLKDFELGKTNLVAPELSKFEVGNALLYKKTGLPSAKSSLVSYYNVPINFVSWESDLSQKTLEMAAAGKITYYDASFLALAESLGSPLVTANPKHQRPIPGWKVKVIPLKDYK